MPVKKESLPLRGGILFLQRSEVNQDIWCKQPRLIDSEQQPLH